jgi:hypothetical protein
MPYLATNPAPYPYRLGLLGTTGDGLRPVDAAGTASTGPLVRQSMLYAWLSNQVTVRSDTYIAYIYVEEGLSDTILALPPGSPERTAALAAVRERARRYVALIDRSQCWTAADQPKVLMFTQIK